MENVRDWANSAYLTEGYIVPGVARTGVKKMPVAARTLVLKLTVPLVQLYPPDQRR
jgi:hypothetical protein